MIFLGLEGVSLHLGSRVARHCNCHTMTDNGGKAQGDTHEAAQAGCQVLELSNSEIDHGSQRAHKKHPIVRRTLDRFASCHTLPETCGMIAGNFDAGRSFSDRRRAAVKNQLQRCSFEVPITPGRRTVKWPCFISAEFYCTLL